MKLNISYSILLLIIFLFIVNGNAQEYFTDTVGAVFENKRAIKKKEWNSNYEMLEQYNKNFKYYTVESNKLSNFQTCFVIREYDSESIHWLLLLDEKQKVIDFLMTAYDNAEGFLEIKSDCYTDKITVNTYNSYEKPEEQMESYVPSSKGFLLKNDLIFEYSESYGSSCCPRDPFRDSVKVGLKEFVTKFEQENSISLKETYMVIQGKEGEKTYYLSFKGWSKAMREKFIKKRTYEAAFLRSNTSTKVTYNDIIKNNRKELIFKLN